MPLILIVLIVVLIAQIGFWDTLGAILGAFAMVLLLVAILVAAIGLGLYMVYRRARRRF